MKIGIIGAGQLARMLALAAHPLHVEVHCAGDALDDSAAPVSELIVEDLTNKEAMREFASRVDVITFENENVDIAVAEYLAGLKPLLPGVEALRISQDRLFEKEALLALGIPVAPFEAVDNEDDIVMALEKLGAPAILKTRRFGYDGKGQFKINSVDDIAPALKELGEQALILEAFVPFFREVSMIAVRRRGGHVRFYPLTENRHIDGILRISIAPYKEDILQQQAEEYVNTLMDSLDYVGVIAIEFFVTDEGLIANEFAPRVHNSGHWTIEGAETSQFENHIRAICDYPLGETRLIEPCIMLNAIGHMPSCKDVMPYKNVHYHHYGKMARPKRKLGHITICNEDGNFSEHQALVNLLLS